MPYWNYPQYPYYQQSFAQNNMESIKWVDGEIGAKAFQMPQGWPPETPIALWDNSEKRIWLKSWNAMGMPNPMQEITYTIKEKTNPTLLPTSGDTQQYVTKEDFDELKEEIRNITRSMQNNNQNNRGGNRQ